VPLNINMILVPTDFSRLSLDALDYAGFIANKLNGSVTILHIMETKEHDSERSLIEQEAKQKLTEIEFYDMLGRFFGKITHSSNETISVNGNFLGAGLYLVKVTTFDVVNGRSRELDKLTQKIVKLR